MRRTIFNLMLTLGLALVWAPLAFASPASYKGASADGEVVFFETDQQLIPGDTDTKRDVYERAFEAEVGIESYVTRQVSLGPAGGNAAYNALFEKTNTDGSLVFFSTEESLVAADADLRADVYLRDRLTGTTTLVSVGAASCAPACGNGSNDVGFAAASTNGSRAFLVTKESLTSEDTDSSADIYVRDLTAGTTSLASAGASSCAPACGNDPFDVALRGIAPTGSHAYFTTTESLAGADADSAADIYSRAVVAGTTTLVSHGGEACAPACGNSGAVPVFQGSSDGGGRAFFSTDEALVAGDTDSATDIYARDLPGGPTILISGGTSSTQTASFAAATGDGSRVFFTSAEGLVGEDSDGFNDVYAWTGGTLALVTPASCSSSCGATFDAAGDDGETVIFSTAEPLSGLDTDAKSDVYSQEIGGGAPTLISRGTGCGACGNGAFDARFDRASADAARVVFTSAEVLAGDDIDSEDDIYARDVLADETSLVTTAPSYCPLKKGNCGATFVGASDEGGHVFFTTVERFKLEDGDDEVDVYERFLGATQSENVTRLVSTDNSPDLDLGPAAPQLKETDPVSPAASTSPRIVGDAEAGSTVKIYETANCSGEPVAHGTAADLASPGVGVNVAVGETTRFWATAEAEGFVSLCSAPISYTQQSSGSGGGGSEGGGSGEGGSTEQGGTKKTSASATVKSFAYVTPRTRITFAPASKTRARRPVLRFTDSTGQPGTNFLCKVDRKPWKGCTSPLRVKRLSLGSHVIGVKAINALGVSEPRPVKRRFKVVRR